MPNPFDQYAQPENKLTHALVCTLGADRSLLVPFLRWLGASHIPPADRIVVVEQQLPGALSSGPEDLEDRRGLPDAAFHDGEEWAVLIEAKIQSRVSEDQLRRHRDTARRCGFANPLVMVLAVDAVQGLPSKEWREVYAWFRDRAAASEWASRFAEYVEIFEAKAIGAGYEIRGTLTMFDGIRFDERQPYTWAEGKRVIRLLGDALQSRQDVLDLGVDPNGERRGAISGRGNENVWDFLPLLSAPKGKQFTSHPHLTMVIGRLLAKAAVTIPNSMQGGFKSRLHALGPDGFRDLIADIARRLDPVIASSTGAQPTLYAAQRHYRTRSSPAVVDGRLNVDIGVLHGAPKRSVKAQPEWIDGVYALLANKRSNVQWGIEIVLSYGCPRVRSQECADLFAESWTAAKPIVDFAVGQ